MENKNVKPITIAYAILIIAAAYLIVIGVMLYGFNSQAAIVGKTAKIFPYPAAKIGFASFASYNDLENNLKAIRNFYEKQDFSSVGLRVDFNTDDGQKRLMVKEKDLLNKMIENKVIQKLANDRDVSITPAMAAESVDQQIAQYGNHDDVVAMIQNLYGWTLKDFEEKIAIPDIYRDELQKNLESTDMKIAQARGLITQAKDELDNKKDFAEVAKTYSQGASADNGGELGWFTADQMVPEISVAAFILNKGQTSDIIRSSLGFHIIQVEDKKTENGVDKVRIRQIFAKTTSFGDWLTEQEKSMNIYIPLKGFVWNKNTAQVEFTDNSLKDFENNLDNNSAGDASILF